MVYAKISTIHKHLCMYEIQVFKGGNTMSDQYYIVKREVVPEIYSKIIEVKKLLRSGGVHSINEAVKIVGISICFENPEPGANIDMLLHNIRQIEGVSSVAILAMQ